ncbi:hypothetical protein GCM10027267_06460 [Paramicrobacterium agarici]
MIGTFPIKAMQAWPFSADDQRADSRSGVGEDDGKMWNVSAEPAHRLLRVDDEVRHEHRDVGHLSFGGDLDLSRDGRRGLAASLDENAQGSGDDGGREQCWRELRKKGVDLAGAQPLKLAEHDQRVTGHAAPHGVQNVLVRGRYLGDDTDVVNAELHRRR